MAFWLGMGCILLTLLLAGMAWYAWNGRRQASVRHNVGDRFAQMFYLLPSVATITDVATGRFVDVNHMWEPMFGFSRAETIGHTSVELDAWGCADARKTVVSTIMRDGVINEFSFQGRRKDKTLFDCVLSGQLIDFDSERYLLLIIRDVTEALRTDRALRESEAKFATIFRESLVPLLLSQPETSVVLDVNQAWLDVMHWQQADVVGLNALALGYWAREDERAEVMARLASQGRADHVECHLRTGTGAVRLCRCSCRIVVMGEQRRLLWSLQDITEQRAMEEQIQTINATLELRVKARTAELEQANSELQQANDTLRHAQDELVRSEKLAALGGLVAGVAHELNTPIGISVTAASTLQSRTEQFRREMLEGTPKRSSLEGYLDSAILGSQLLMRNLEQASELVRSFKQVAVDRTSDLRRSFDMKALIDELLRAHRASIGHSGCAVKVEIDVEPQLILDSFPGALGQVIGNFIANTLIHGFEGREHGCIRIHAVRKDGERAELSFADDGIGVPVDDLRRIFDPFFTTKFGQGGCGLGLHIVYNIVTNVLGGKIDVESTPGQGTRFTLDLPLRAPEGMVINPMQLAGPISHSSTLH